MLSVWAYVFGMAVDDGPFPCRTPVGSQLKAFKKFLFFQILLLMIPYYFSFLIDFYLFISFAHPKKRTKEKGGANEAFFPPDSRFKY